MKTEPKHEPLLGAVPPYHLRTRHPKPHHLSTTQPPSPKQPPRKKPKKTTSHPIPPSPPPSTPLSSSATPAAPSLFNNLQRLSDYLDDHLPVLMLLTMQIIAAILLGVLAVMLVGLVVGVPVLFLWRAAEGAWTWVSGPDKGWGLGEGMRLCLGEVQVEVPGSLLLVLLALVVL